MQILLPPTGLILHLIFSSITTSENSLIHLDLVTLPMISWLSHSQLSFVTSMTNLSSEKCLHPSVCWPWSVVFSQNNDPLHWSRTSFLWTGVNSEQYLFKRCCIVGSLFDVLRDREITGQTLVQGRPLLSIAPPNSRFLYTSHTSIHPLEIRPRNSSLALSQRLIPNKGKHIWFNARKFDIHILHHTINMERFLKSTLWDSTTKVGDESREDFCFPILPSIFIYVDQYRNLKWRWPRRQPWGG